MKKSFQTMGLAALIGGLAVTGLAAPAYAQTQPAQPISATLSPSEISTVRGNMEYNSRILPRPGWTAMISLQDVSVADRAAPVISSVVYDMEGVGSPFGYELRFPSARLRAGGRYSVRGQIFDAQGKLRFTSDTANLINPSVQNQILPTIALVPTGGQSSDNSKSNDAAMLTKAPWRVEYVDGRGVVDGSKTSIAFMPGGKVAGSTGCNQYTGTYMTKGDMIDFGPLAVTRRACVPALGKQESAFLSVMDKANRYRVDEKGTLFIYTSDGKSLAATQYVAAQPY